MCEPKSLNTCWICEKNPSEENYLLCEKCYKESLNPMFPMFKFEPKGHDHD